MSQQVWFNESLGFRGFGCTYDKILDFFRIVPLWPGPDVKLFRLPFDFFGQGMNFREDSFHEYLGRKMDPKILWAF